MSVEDRFSDTDAAVLASDEPVRVELPPQVLHLLFGPRDEHLKRIESSFGVKLSARGSEVRLAGSPESVDKVRHLLADLGQLLDAGHRLSGRDVETSIRVVQQQPEASLVEFFGGGDSEETSGRFVQPRSLNQKLYQRAMQERDLVIAIGPAGTGKTYLAVATAAAYLVEKKVRRIILARPAVEAGEKLGFLPGDIAEKVNPYLRPLHDALHDILGFEKVERLIERGVIEVAPIAFMRGRTLNDSFIILDEAQNTTAEQMKMFLTRIGFGSKTVVTGDVTQIDLPAGRISGLKQIEKVLDGISGLAFVRFGQHDVVRHPLVQKIVQAYARFEDEAEQAPKEGRPTLNLR